MLKNSTKKGEKDLKENYMSPSITIIKIIATAVLPKLYKFTVPTSNMILFLLYWTLIKYQMKNWCLKIILLFEVFRLKFFMVVDIHPTCTPYVEMQKHLVITIVVWDTQCFNRLWFYPRVFPEKTSLINFSISVR